jgi:hypothetical protein
LPPCYRDPEGNCYRAGEFCPSSLRGKTVEGEDGPIICEENDGLRWEPAAATSAGGGTSAIVTQPATNAVTAPSSSLAFTGPGPGLKTATIMGIALIVLGIVLLFLVDIPRRTLRLLARFSHRP